MKKQIKTIPLLFEVVEQSEGKVTYIIRHPQTAQVLFLGDSFDEVAQFLNSLSIQPESKNE